MQVQFSMHLIMPTISLLSIAPKRNKRVVFLSTIHAKPRYDEDAGKEEINVFYNHEKGGVDSHNQMCALYTAARKTNRWPMRVFYGMVDSSALSAYLIFTQNVPVFGGKEGWHHKIHTFCEKRSNWFQTHTGRDYAHFDDVLQDLCHHQQHDDVVLCHTLPVFTGLGRCPIVSWDFAGAVSIFGLDALLVIHQ